MQESSSHDREGDLSITKICQVLGVHADLELAVLVGSRAENRARPESDWDIAIQWKREITMLENLANTETLRHELAVTLGVGENGVDLICRAPNLPCVPWLQRLACN